MDCFLRRRRRRDVLEQLGLRIYPGLQPLAQNVCAVRGRSFHSHPLLIRGLQSGHVHVYVVERIRRGRERGSGG